MLDLAQGLPDPQRRDVAEVMLDTLRERFDSLANIPTVNDAFRPVLERVLASGLVP